jgi:hypothetical protein
MTRYEPKTAVLKCGGRDRGNVEIPDDGIIVERRAVGGLAAEKVVITWLHPIDT